jgi:hypothetical protein
MMATLLVDAIRRKRFGIAFAVFQVYLICKILLKIWPEAQVAACAMAFGSLGQVAFGPLLFQSRELYMLPVSRQTWWRTSWWIGTAGVSAMAVTGVTLAAWEVRSEIPAFAPVSLILVLCFLYSAVGETLHARYQRPLDAPATLGSLALAPLLLLWIVAAPFVLATWLPHAWSELSLPTTAVLVLVAALGVPGYLHRPAIEARPDMRAARPAVQLAAPSHLDAPAPRPAFADRLTGWRLVLWDETRKHLYLFCFVIGLAIVAWAVASLVRPVPDLVSFLRNADAFPFSSRAAHITEPITWGVLVFATAFLDPWMASSLRPLRALPMSSGRLACLPVAMGLLASITLGAILLLLHLVVLRTLPVALRLDLFVAFAAVIALGYTIRFMAPVRPRAATASMAPIVIVWLVLGYFSDDLRASAVQTAALVGGPLCLAASYGVMRLALTRYSRLYRQRPMSNSPAIAP